MRLLSVSVAVVLATVSVWAQVPRVLSYQGILTDRDGRILPDGDYELQIRLYDRLDATEPLYSERQRVTSQHGVVNVLIGTVEPLPERLTFDRVYYVGVSVNGSEELQPRTMLTAVPYALRAESAATADVAHSLAPEALKGVTVQATPSGPAGGDLSGTYPNPYIGSSKVTTVKIATAAVTTDKIASRAVTGNKINQMGATHGQVLTWVTGSTNDWKPTSVSAWAWALTGNSGTNPTTNFLGTTDAQPLVIRTNNVERLRVTVGGNVGIGTNSPAATLDVVGAAQVSGNTSVGGNLSVGGNGSVTGNLTVDGNTTLGNAATDVVVFTARVQSDVVPLANNTYDLGSSSLRWANVYGVNGDFSTLTVSGLTSGSVIFAGTGGVLSQDNANFFWDDGNNRLGIGTASPTATLHVVGTAQVSGNTSVGGNLTVAGDATVSGTTVALPNIPSGSAATEVLVWNGGNVEHRSASGLISGFAWMLGGNTLASEQTLGTLSAHDLPIITAGTEKVRITQAGDVGIGTSTPGARLHVAGTGRFDGQLTVTTGGAAITGNSTVTGTLTVSSDVSVGGNGSVTGNLTVDGNTTLGNATVDLVTFNARVQSHVVPSADNAYDLGENTTPLRWRNVYGVNGDFSTLTVSGLTPSSVIFAGTGGALSQDNANFFWDDANNRLGIGTSTPGARLHVAGTGRFDGQLTVTAGGAVITGNSTVTGTLTVSSDVSVGGNGSVTGNLTVAGDATVSGTTVALPNIPSGSAATEALVWNGGNVEHRSASGLISGFAWMLGGNTLASEQTLGTLSAHDLPIITAGTEKVRITQAGDVGIGTSTPGARLHVAGTGRFDGQLTVTAGGAVITGNSTVTGTLTVSSDVSVGGDGSVTGNLTVDGNTTLGNAATDVVVFTARVGSHVVPSANNTYDLGSNSLRWANVYGVNGDFSSLTVSGLTPGSVIFADTGGVLSQNNANFYWDNTTARLGIGTTTPTATLHVVGTAQVSGNTSVGGNLTVAGDATVSGTTVALPNIPSGSAATDVLVRTGTGNVEHRSASGLISGFVWLLGGNTLASEQTLGTLSAHDLPIITAGTEKVRITQAGDVGIGTSTPGARLHVAGTGRFDGQLTVTAGGAAITGNSTVTGTLTVSSDVSVGGNGSVTGNLTVSGTTVALPNIPSGSAATDVLVRTGTGNVEHRSASGLISGFAWMLGGNTLASEQTLGTLSAHDLPIITAGTEKVRITQAGDVGIGTSTPGARLHVAGTGRFDGQLTVTAGGAAITGNSTVTGTLTVSSDVSVGGDGSVTGNLTVDGDATVSGTTVALPNIPSGSAATEVLVWNGGNVEHRSASGLISGFAWMLGGNTLASEQTLGTLSAHDLPIITAGTEKVRITQAGDVGIGTSTPGARLHVAGTGRFDGQLTVTAGGAAITGNSTVTGTLTVSSDVSVGGDGSVTGDLTVDGNTTLGNDAAVDLVTFNARVGSHVVPSANNTYDLGSSSLRWANVYGVNGNFSTVTVSGLMPGSVIFADAGGALSQNNAKFFWDNGNERLGIGTAAPAATLHVVGTAQVSGNTSVEGDLSVGGNGSVTGNLTVAGNTTLGDNAAVDLVTVNAGTVALPNIPSGSAATEVLVWNGGNVEHRSASGLISGFAWMLGGNTLLSEQTLGTSSAHDLPIITAGTEKVRITQAGDVGIGTSTPGAKLHVAGTGRFDGQLTVTTGGAAITGNSTVTGTLTVSSDVSVGGNGSMTGNLTVSGATVSLPNIPSGSTATDVLVRTGTGNVEYRSASSLVGTPGWLLGGNTLTSVQTLGTQSNHDLPIITNSTERMRVTVGGNVGIGTTTPAATLHVVGTAQVSGNTSVGGNLTVNGATVSLPNIPSGSTATDVLVRTGTGNVEYRSASSLVGTPGWLLGGNTLTSVQTLGTQSNHDLPIITNSTERMRVTVGGNVGIGTTTPAATLHVVGTGRFDGQLTVTAGGAAITGNSTVTGTLTVSSDVSVGGNGSVTGNLTVDGNTTLGDAATDVVVFTARVGSHVVPSANNTYDLGSSSLRWANVYGVYGDFSSLMVSGLTPGSVVFAGTGGALSENNANIFWDNTNTRLGIGTNSPTAALDLRPENSERGLVIRAGTTPTDNLFRIESNSGQYRWRVDQNFDLFVTDGSGTDRAVWKNTGSLGIGTVSPATHLHVNSTTNGAVYARFTNANVLTGFDVGIANTTGIAELRMRDNAALEMFVNDQHALRLEPTQSTANEVPNIIGGHSANAVTAGKEGAFIGGGMGQSIQANFAVIVGGYDNVVSGDSAGILAGTSNNISGEWSVIGAGSANDVLAKASLIGAGSENLINFGADFSAIVAGTDNNGTGGMRSFIGAGRYNSTTGDNSGILAGVDNSTSGTSSMAIGSGLLSKSYREVVVGSYNSDYTPNSTTAWNATDRLFVVGNGQDGTTRSDALIIWKNGDAQLFGTVILGDATSDNVTFIARVNSHIHPATDATYDLGSNTLRWQDGWFSGTVTSQNATVTSLTPGSVIFAGTGGALSQDNANFFWDDGNNRLGIGTASPTERLQVHNGNVAITNSGTAGQLRLHTPGGANYTAFVAQGQTGNITYTLPADLSVGTLVSGGRILQSDGSGNLSWLDPSALATATAWTLTGNAITGTEFLGTTNNQPLVIRTNNIERIRINANGNVGIATNAPSVPLDVAGSVRLATSAGTTVVIGNVSADGKLRVDGTIRADGYRTADGTSGVPSYRFVNSASTGMFSPSANQLALATSGSERLRIDASGNVGIGTTSPTARLEVAGSLRVTGNLDVTGTKNFCIPHPLEPERKVLRHAAIESNEVLNQYSGNVILDDAGQAWVELPTWFEAINCDYRYQLTCIGTFAPVYIAEECRSNKFKIAGGKPGMKVSWQLTAVRNDAYIRSNPFRAEEDAPVGSAIGGNDVR